MAARAAALTPEALIDLIVSSAPRLRAAGVLQLQLGTTFVVLAPAPPAEMVLAGDRPRAANDSGEVEPGESDFDGIHPLDDPRTYGRKTGTPGFTRPKKEDPT